MSEQSLKAKLKPLIRECIKEVMLEDGMLSGIISEALKGVRMSGLLNEVQQSPVVAQAKTAQKMQESRAELAEKMEADRQMRIRKMNENASSSLGIKGKKVNFFEGTKPIGETINERMEQGTPRAVKSAASIASNPLADTDPNDPGVSDDAIEALFAMR